MQRVFSGAQARIVGLAGALASHPSANAPVVSAEPAPDPELELERARRAAFETAQAEGFAQGLVDAEAEVARRARAAERDAADAYAEASRLLQADRAAVRDLLAGLSRLQDGLDARIGETAAEIAYQALARVLGESAADRMLMVRVCGQALEDFKVRPVVVKAAAEDAAVLTELSDSETMRIVADPGLQPGHLRLETHKGSYETSLEMRLEAVKQAFLQGVTQEPSA